MFNLKRHLRFDNFLAVLLVFLCIALMATLLTHQETKETRQNLLYEEEVKEEKQFIHDMLTLTQKITRSTILDENLVLNTSEKETKIELDKEQELASLYFELKEKCELPTLKTVKAKMHCDYLSFYGDEDRFDFAWKEAKWVEYYVYLNEYSNDKINNWCTEMGRILNCSIFWGRDNDTVEDINFHHDRIRLKLDSNRSSDFQITIKDIVTGKVFVLRQPNKGGLTEFHLDNSYHPYSIQVLSDGYWCFCVNK